MILNDRYSAFIENSKLDRIARQTNPNLTHWRVVLCNFPSTYSSSFEMRSMARATVLFFDKNPFDSILYFNT